MYPLDDDGKQQRLTHENKLKAQPTREKEYAVSSRGPAMFRPFSLLLTFPILIAADSNPLIDQFNRLMGEPREIVGALVNYPWKAGRPESLDGFQRVPPGASIRIVSLELPLSEYARWAHWTTNGRVHGSANWRRSLGRVRAGGSR